MKRSHSRPKLWEAAIPTTKYTSRIWTRIHGGKDEQLGRAIVVAGNERSESFTASDVPTLKRKKPDISAPPMSTYVVGLCLTPKQREVVRSMLVVEKMAYRFAAGLFARTVRGQHMLACNDPGTRKKALAAAKGCDLKGHKLESFGAVWKYIQSVVVHTDRDKVLKERLKPEDRDLLPPKRYHFSRCGTQPMLSGLTRFKAAVAGSWRKVKSWNGTLDDDGLPLYDIDEKHLTGSCLVQKAYCRLLGENDVKGGDRKLLKNRLCLLPAIMAGNSLHAHWADRRHRFVRITKNVNSLPPFNHDLKIVKCSRSKYRLHIPCQVHHTRSHCKAPDEPEKAVCSIDPGCRTFATIYDPTRIVALAYGTKEQRDRHLEPLFAKQDMVRSQLGTILKKVNSATGKKAEELKTSVTNLTAHLKKIGRKLQGQVTAFHRKLTGHLAQRYHTVVLGKIGVAGIVSKDRNRLASKANRRLLAWNHFKFRERLLARAAGDISFHVFVQDERDTSRTCGRCDKINYKLKGKDTFHCSHCNFNTDRDVNGARNILRKFLGLMM